MSIGRRNLISFGFLRKRGDEKPAKPAADRPPPVVPRSGSFSIEDFYRARERDGSRDAALPTFRIVASFDDLKGNHD